MGRVAVLLMAVWLAGCGEAERTQRELVDDGQVCLQLQGDGRVKVSLQFHTCLRSCDIAKPGTCSVSGDGQSLRVASRGVVETIEGESCSSACGSFGASCESEATFAPGTYTVVHGTDSALIALGSQVQCLFVE
jgi:hypothetical protein